MSTIPAQHKSRAPISLGVYVITCSTSRYNDLKGGKASEDQSGDLIENLSKKAGHQIVGRELLSDSTPMIRRTVKKAFAAKAVDVIIITGGTGISPRDVTIESIARFVQKEIPGFGEMFRKISYDEIGSAAIMSRAFAGLRKGKAIFCLPGSPDAVRTAMEKLILPELGHIIGIGHEH